MNYYIKAIDHKFILLTYSLKKTITFLLFNNN